MRKPTLTAILAATAAAATAAYAQRPSYVPTPNLHGELRVWGSPQMGDLLALEEAGFARLQPGVTFHNDLKSTITAVAGIYTGRADIGLLGREIWSTEQQAFESIAGKPPAVVEVATGSYDVPKATFALMVFVPQANPLASVSLEQLADIFATPAGELPRAHTWAELGLTGAWAARPIHLYGFPIDNDKSQIFATLVFPKATHWNPALHEFNNLPDADAGQRIVEAVAADPDALGISNAHYATPAVRALPIRPRAGAPAIVPTRATVASRQYPLTRAVYVVASPAANPLTQAFLRYVVSREGQSDVVKEGNYLPLR